MAWLNKKTLFFILLIGLGQFVFLTAGCPQPINDNQSTDECGLLTPGSSGPDVSLVGNGQCHSISLNMTAQGAIPGGCTCSFWAQDSCAGSPWGIGLGPYSGPIYDGPVPSTTNSVGSYLCNRSPSSSPTPKNGTFLLPPANPNPNFGTTSTASDNGLILCKDVNYSGGCFWFASSSSCVNLESMFLNIAHVTSSMIVFGCFGSFYEYPDCAIRGPTTFFTANAAGGTIAMPMLSEYWNDRMVSFMCS